MPNTGIDYKKIREELDMCKKPLFLYHDDADGLSSFLLLYRYKKEGQGFIVKQTPVIDERFLRKVEEYQPDKIFIVDIARVEDSFTDNVHVPIIWIDHHGPYDAGKTKYFNPRLKDPSLNLPASYLCYKVVEQDLWVAMTGIVGDWVYHEETYKKFAEEYADLLSVDVKTPEKALFDTKIGEMAKIFNFVLKGDVKSALQCAKVLTRIKDPYEIFNQTTSQGKYIWKKYKKVADMYDSLLADAKKSESDEKVILFKYYEDKTSFTGEVANELLYRNPEKIIIIARMKGGEAKCSVRSGKNIILPPLLEKAMMNLGGRSGGHEHACGAVLPEENLKELIENIKKEI